MRYWQWTFFAGKILLKQPIMWSYSESKKTKRKAIYLQYLHFPCLLHHIFDCHLFTKGRKNIFVRMGYNQLCVHMRHMIPYMNLNVTFHEFKFQEYNILLLASNESNLSWLRQTGFFKDFSVWSFTQHSTSFIVLEDVLLKKWVTQKIYNISIKKCWLKIAIEWKHYCGASHNQSLILSPHFH